MLIVLRSYDYSKVGCYRHQGLKDQRSHSMLYTPAAVVGIDRFHCYDLGDFGCCFVLQVYYYLGYCDKSWRGFV